MAGHVKAEYLLFEDELFAGGPVVGFGEGWFGMVFLKECAEETDLSAVAIAGGALAHRRLRLRRRSRRGDPGATRGRPGGRPDDAMRRGQGADDVAGAGLDARPVTPGTRGATAYLPTQARKSGTSA